MSNNILIRKVDISEADALIQLSRQTFLDAFATINKAEDIAAYTTANFTITKIVSELNTPGSAFYFAVHQDEIIGYLKLNTNAAQTEFKDKHSLEVERIYILAKHQGKKLGEQLLNYAIATAKQAHYKCIWLGVWEHNYSAIRFYERYGFAKFGSHYFMLGTDKQTDILMRKELI